MKIIYLFLTLILLTACQHNADSFTIEGDIQNIRQAELYIFDESQKECNSEIWISAYDIVRLLSNHRSSLQKTALGWQRRYPYRDLDTEELGEGAKMLDTRKGE